MPRQKGLTVAMIVAGGATLPIGILIVSAAPAVIVVGYHVVGHRHQRRTFEAS